MASLIVDMPRDEQTRGHFIQPTPVARTLSRLRERSEIIAWQCANENPDLTPLSALGVAEYRVGRPERWRVEIRWRRIRERSKRRLASAVRIGSPLPWLANLGVRVYDEMEKRWQNPGSGGRGRKSAETPEMQELHRRDEGPPHKTG